jgi:S1-C subfamily serine protease
MRAPFKIAIIATLVLVGGVAGGLAAIGIGKLAGLVGSTQTVVLESAVSTPAAPASTTAVAPVPAGRFDPEAIYRQRADGVVTIYALFSGHADGAIAEAQGSGFVVSDSGYVLTNSHVITTAGSGTGKVQPAAQVFVEFRDGARAAAHVVGWDAYSDIGVLSVDPASHPLTALPLGESEQVAVGEPVAAIGSPFGQTSSLTVGVVSATGRSVASLTSRYELVDAIQTDAPINHGNSGGPLFNARGEVIGINAQIRSQSGANEGVSFAIPIDTARRSMRQLIESGVVHYAWIGVSTDTVTPSIAKEVGLPVDHGAAVRSVVEDSPAAKAGLRGGGQDVFVDGQQFSSGGDIVVAIDGHPVRSTEDLIRIVIAGMAPGETARFTVVRDGDRVVVPIVLGERPANPDTAG